MFAYTFPLSSLSNVAPSSSLSDIISSASNISSSLFAAPAYISSNPFPNSIASVPERSFLYGIFTITILIRLGSVSSFCTSAINETEWDIAVIDPWFGTFVIPFRYCTVYISWLLPWVTFGRTMNCPLLNDSAFIVPICPAVLPKVIVPKSSAPFTVIVPVFVIVTPSIEAVGPLIVISPTFVRLPLPSTTPSPPDIFIVPLLRRTPSVPKYIPVLPAPFTFIVP